MSFGSIFHLFLNIDCPVFINISFSGTIRNDHLGVYRIFTPNKKKFLITTQFEPHFSTLCFPCIVDYSFRCCYALSITVEQTLQVLFCMPVQTIALDFTSSSKKSAIQLHTYSFTDTPSIPAYLLAFSIGNFSTEKKQYKSSFSETSHNIDLTCYVPNQFYSSIESKQIFSTVLEASTHSLIELEKYFKMGFMFDKLDFLIVPEMLLSGMENWTLCFLHVIPGKFEPFSLQKSLFHEITHQWIGNYIGMSFSMKEGIVSYLEDKLSPILFGKSQRIKTPSSKTQQTKWFLSFFSSTYYFILDQQVNY